MQQEPKEVVVGKKKDNDPNEADGVCVRVCVIGGAKPTNETNTEWSIIIVSLRYRDRHEKRGKKILLEEGHHHQQHMTIYNFLFRRDWG